MGRWVGWGGRVVGRWGEVGEVFEGGLRRGGGEWWYWEGISGLVDEADVWVIGVPGLGWEVVDWMKAVAR